MREKLMGEGAALGADCTAVCGNNIGKYAFVGAGAVVTADVPDQALEVGSPARLKGWMAHAATNTRILSTPTSPPPTATMRKNEMFPFIDIKAQPARIDENMRSRRDDKPNNVSASVTDAVSTEDLRR